MIAMLSRKALSAAGTRGPSRASTPRANAISVAAGTAYPRSASALPALKTTKHSAGNAMPPTAANAGRRHEQQASGGFEPHELLQRRHGPGECGGRHTRHYPLKRAGGETKDLHPVVRTHITTNVSTVSGTTKPAMTAL